MGAIPELDPCSREERAAIIIDSTNGTAVAVAQHACSIFVGATPELDPCSREERAAIIIDSTSGVAVAVAQHACSVLVGAIPERDPCSREQRAVININMYQWHGCSCRSSSVQRTRGRDPRT